LIASGAIASAATGKQAYYQSGAGASDMQVTARLAAISSSGTSVGLFVRFDGSSGFLVDNTGSSTWRIYRTTGGTTETQLISVTGDAPAVGDCIGGTAVGSMVIGWLQPGCSGAWHSEVTYSSAGAIAGWGGVFFGAATGDTLDDFTVGPNPDAPATVTATTTLYTSPATVTVTTAVGGGGGTVAMGSNCGGTTTDAGGSTVDQAPCMVDVSSGGLADGNLEYIWWGVWVLGGICLFGFCVAPHWNRLFNWWGNPQ
jgi:hypothetical protein